MDIGSIFLVIWISLIVIAGLSLLVYFGYKGDELDFRDKEDLENIFLAFIFLPVILFAAPIVLVFWVPFGFGKLIRYYADKHGRSKKNGT